MNTPSKPDQSARKIVARLIVRARQARRRAAALPADCPVELRVMRDAEAAEAHNAAEVSRRLLYQGYCD